MAENKIYIAGADRSNDIAEIDDLVFDFSTDETDTYSFAVSDELTFTGTAFQDVFNLFQDNCNGQLEVDIYIGCCDETFTFTIDPGRYKVLPDECIAKVNLTQVNADAQAFKCLDRIIEIARAGATGFSDIIFEHGTDEDQDIADIKMNPVYQFMDYFCAQCGLTFESSILKDDPLYRNSMLYNASRIAGLLFSDGGRINTHNARAIEYLELLKDPFNAEYRINGGVLRFERKDYFYQNGQVYADIEELIANGCVSENPTYELDRDNHWAWARFEYVADGVETQGNKKLADYNTLVSWNPLQLQYLNGEYKKIMRELSPTFVQDDGDIEVKFKFGIENFKLWVWDGVVQTPAKLVNSTDGGWNYAAKFDEAFTSRELYKEFHYIDQPGTICRYKVSGLTISPPNFCEIVSALKENGVNGTFQTRFGKLVAKSIKVNFKKRAITINNGKIYV